MATLLFTFLFLRLTMKKITFTFNDKILAKYENNYLSLQKKRHPENSDQQEDFLMTKTTKEISISSFDKIAQEHFPATITTTWFAHELIIKSTLSLPDMLTFVNDVVSSCFSEDGEYMPEVKDFAIKSNILSKYANIVLPDDLELRYGMTYATDAAEIILNHVNHAQFAAILQSIDEKITYLSNSHLSALENQMEKFISTFANLEDLQKKSEELLTAFDKEDLKTLVAAIKNDNNLALEESF